MFSPSLRAHLKPREHFTTFLFINFFAAAFYLLEDSMSSSIFTFPDNLFGLSNSPWADGTFWKSSAQEVFL